VTKALSVPFGVLEQQNKRMGDDGSPCRPALGRERAAEFLPLEADALGELANRP
jgi:hypothetical protein